MRYCILWPLVSVVVCLMLALHAWGAPSSYEVAVGQGKAEAATLLKAGRNQEAYELYMRLLREEPDDDEINVGLARSSAAVGEVNQAVLAMERLVDKYPRNGPIRLQLARLLLRVDDLEAARLEFELARELDPNLSDALIEQALVNLQGEIPRWQVAGRLSGGILYDSNVNMGPQSSFLQLGYWPLQFDSSIKGQDSWGGYTSASLDVGWRTSDKSSWWVIGDVGMFRKGYFSDMSSNRELGWSRASLGLRRIGTSCLFDLRMKTEKAVYPGDNQAVNINGPEATFLWALSPSFSFLSRGSVERRDYKHNFGRQGLSSSVGQYARVFFGKDNHEMLVGGRYIWSDTKDPAFASEASEGTLRFVFKLPLNLELAPFALLRRESFRGPATILEFEKRKDHTLQVGSALTWYITPALSCDLTWQRADNTSSSPLYEYKQQTFSAGMTWRF